MSDVTRAVTGRAHDARVWRQAAEPLSLLTHLGVVLFLGFVLWRASGDALSAALCSGLGLVVMAPIGLRFTKPPAAWLVPYGALVGLLWTLCLALWFPAGVFSLQLALGIAAAGAALALAFSLNGHFWAGFAAVAAPLPVLSVLMLADGAGGSPWPGILLAAFWLGIVWFMRQLGSAARMRAAFQVEREELIAKLADKARELETAQAEALAARAEAEEANTAKSRFLAQSSHDLRQPLHAMGLVLETLPTASEDAQVGGVVDRVKQSLAMLTQLFDSLLDLTMLDTGQIEVRSEAFSAEAMLRQVRDDFGSIADANGMDLRVAPTNLWLVADPVVLRRVVQNLVSNAIRHSGSGSVLIGARRVNGRAAIDVLDTGPGIAAEDQKRIFQEFTTLGAESSRDESPGVGLGLAIVHRMSAALGLEVSVRSRVGRGSRFRISNLAIAEEPKRAERCRADAVAASDARSSRIAVFDDDVDTLNATAALLRKWGFEVDAFEAWPGVVEDPPDMLVCDYQLGTEETGVEVVERVRRSSQREVPALIITGADPQMVKEQTRALGLPVLAKPVGPAQLRSAILAALAPDA